MFTIRSSRGYIQALDSTTTPVTISWNKDVKTAMTFEDEKTAKQLYDQAYKMALTQAKAARAKDVQNGGRKVKISWLSGMFHDFLMHHYLYHSYTTTKLKFLKNPPLSAYNASARKNAYKLIVRFCKQWLDDFDPAQFENQTFAQILKPYTHVFITPAMDYYLKHPPTRSVRVQQLKTALDVVKTAAPTQAFVVRHLNGFVSKNSSGSSHDARNNLFNARLFSSYDLAQKAASRYHNAIVLTMDLQIKDAKVTGKHTQKVHPKIQEEHQNLLALIEQQALTLTMQQSYIDRLVAQDSAQNPQVPKKPRAL